VVVVDNNKPTNQMRYYDNGCFYSVQLNRDDVANFKAQWPCNGMPTAPIWFQFDKRNGDLVDMKPSNWEERGADGGAMVALSQDAQTYAKAKQAKIS
jgi:hypothetical protein